LSVGNVNIACSVNSPGDKIYIPITIDYITPGEEISGWQFFIWFDQDIITWDGEGGGGPQLGINYLSPIFPPECSGPSEMWNVSPTSELVWLWGDGTCFLSLAGQTFPHLLIELIFTYQGGLPPGGSSPLIWGTSGKKSAGSNGKGTTEVYTWDEFDYFTLTLNDGSIYIPACLNSFQGDINNDWFEPGNWCFGCVPNNTDVWISPVPVNSPVISGDIAMVDDIHLFADAVLTIASDGGLTINGELINDGTLLVTSDTNGNSGTMINYGEITGTGYFEQDRIITCTGINPGNPSTIGWHFLSSSYEGFTTDDLYDYFINAWNQSAGMWSSYDPVPVYGPCTLWPTTALEPLGAWNINLNLAYPDPTCIPPQPAGTGTLIEFITSNTQVHTGNYQKALGFGSGANQEWNLVGNPYPSGLDLNTIQWGENTVQAAYIYDGCAGNYIYWAAGMGPFVVPPNTGFFVETTGNDELLITNDNRAHNPELYWENEVPNLLTIQASGNGKTDILHIRFGNNVTAGFDKNGDAHKIIMDTEGLPQIYSRFADEKLAINALPKTSSVPVSFISSMSGYYTINAIETSNFNYLMLYDCFTGMQYNLFSEAHPFIYNTGDDPDRFIIYFSEVENEKIVNGKISISIIDQTMFIQSAVRDGLIIVYDLIGQVVLKKVLEPVTMNQVRVGDLHGCFIVKVSTGSFTNTEKVIIR
jgi:hypothetical protein